MHVRFWHDSHLPECLLYRLSGYYFMAYLNGHQKRFTMVGGQQSARSLLHLAELFRLADAASPLSDPELAARRMRDVLRVHGVDA
jgi:hypothetical protein